MLEYKVPIQQNRLHLSQEAVVPVQMRPSRLYHPDLRFRKVMNHLHHPLPRRHEVCIEDRDELASCNIKAFVESPGFVAMSVAAVQIHDRLRLHTKESTLIPFDDLLRYPGRLVR